MDCISLPAWATEAPGSPKSIFVESAPSEESACSLSGDASASEEESPPAAAATHVAVPKGSGASMTRSLTFRDRALESAYLASSSASLVGLDSAASALAVVLWLSFYSKQHWELSLAEKGVFYASVALASLFFCAVPLAPRLRQRLVRHRTACVLALRLMGVGNMVVFGRHSVLPQTISSTTVFKVAVRAAFASKAVPLCVTTVGRQLPFRLHLPSAAVLGATVLAANWGSCQQTCAAADPSALAAVEALVARMLWLASPAFWATGADASVLRMPASPQGQCWLVHCYQALVLGLLLPSLAMYRRERAGRLRFLAAKGVPRPAAVDLEARPLDLPSAAFILMSALAALWVALAWAASELEQRR